MCGPSLYLYGLVSTIASVGYKSIRESDLEHCRVCECSVGELVFGSVTELDLLERVAFWLNTSRRAARAKPEFIELLVPVPGTTCHILQVSCDPLASRRSTRLV